ncbi:hypothetical protein M569_17567, partial [Genlisea aurea]
LQEIAWHRVDELNTANGDVISRGVTGLKLYMVHPFLASLKAWISAHDPPVGPRSDRFLKGFTVWKAKTSSSDNSTLNIGGESSSSSSQPNTTGPGRSFRNFRFDRIPVFQAVDAAFSA